jgi:putative ABC transport system permease protein
VFILLVACINYTNLATARALRRARSTAIRKILGAQRGRLLLEVLGDAVLFSLVSAVLGVALAEFAITMTPIGEMLGPGVQLDLSSDPGLIGWILGGAVVVGLAAGLYPAIYLSSWMPVAAFATRGGGAASGARLREGLVLLQLVIAVGVVAATLVMASQMRYVATRPLGFEQENWVMITVRGTDNWLRVPALATELRRNPRILGVTQTIATPGQYDGGGLMGVENAKGEVQPTSIALMEVDTGFVKEMKIGIVAGQDLPPDARTRAGAHFVVNETMVREMGWSDPIGRRIGQGRVVGVVRDFNFQSLRFPIRPLALVALSDDPQRVAEARRPFVQRRLLIRVSGEDFPGTMKYVEEAIRRFDPGSPFEYELLDETLQGTYSTERRMLSLIAIFAALCIFISCLGLYGLTAFVTERRSREIALRKVLGASAWQVVLLLARRTMLLTCIGGVVAVAIAWLVMDQWLSGFAYRVSVNPLLLSLSILLAAGVSLGTVALQSLQTARADPSETLRDE